MSAGRESAAERKSKIRERYKGISEDELDIIPALPKASLDDDTQLKRVAVYARVSTDDPRQTSSYELQKNHYMDVVSRHPGWELIDIYADEGISGTSLAHRDSFLRMIDDCKSGKIDLILTKSVSRFARNIVDCIRYIRDLRAMTPPIGVMFETEHIYTLDSNSDMSLAFIATLAQEESHTKSEIMNSSVEMRFRRGIFLTPPLLGYDLDEDGNLIINEEEAATVRLIFFLYLYGVTCEQIAKKLTELGRRTKKGNTSWSASAVQKQLQNERHCGDVLSRKTWTPNYLDHKSKKNRQDRNQYLQRNHHEAIISRDDFIAAQHLLRNAKYKNNGILPQLSVMNEGILTGFVLVNPRWSGFKATDYIEASRSITGQTDSENGEIRVSVKDGDFDLRGFEIARSQYFTTGNRISVSFSNDSFQFSIEAVRKLDSEYVELLVHPDRRLIAVRPCAKSERNALRWSKQKNNSLVSRKIFGSAFLPNLFQLFGWNKSFRYRITGFRRLRGSESILVFDLEDTEALIPKSLLPEQDSELVADGKHIVGFPENWTDRFGSAYYRNVQDEENEWHTTLTPVPVETGTPLNPTPPEMLEIQINDLITQMTQENTDD